MRVIGHGSSAEVLDIGAATVKVHLHRGRKALAKTLGALTDGERRTTDPSGEEAPMNDLEHLDQRARRAAADVRSRAADRRRPAFDPYDASLLPAPARLEDRRPRRSLLAAAAVVLLVLGGGLAFAAARHQPHHLDRAATAVPGHRPAKRVWRLPEPPAARRPRSAGAVRRRYGVAVGRGHQQGLARPDGRDAAPERGPC